MRLGTFGDHGQHSREGLFVFSGPDFAAGEDDRVAEMQDLPATLLHVYDIPIPEDWDGDVLLETLAEGLRQSAVQQQPGDLGGAPDYQGIYTKDEGEAIFARLRDLGYM